MTLTGTPPKYQLSQLGHSDDICGDLQLSFELIDFFVSLVATHFADSIFQHYILLEEMVDGHFVLCIVVHRALEEEAEEALSAVATCTRSEVAEQNEVKTERGCKD